MITEATAQRIAVALETLIVLLQKQAHPLVAVPSGRGFYPRDRIYCHVCHFPHEAGTDCPQCKAAEAEGR